MEPLTCPFIDRAELEGMTFPTEDVLSTQEQKQDRKTALHKAVQMGNVAMRKVTVEFWANEGCKRLRTTVWACTPKVVVFKEGMQIPVHRIVAVYHSSVE